MPLNEDWQAFAIVVAVAVPVLQWARPKWEQFCSKCGILLVSDMTGRISCVQFLQLSLLNLHKKLHLFTPGAGACSPVIQLFIAQASDSVQKSRLSFSCNLQLLLPVLKGG